MYNRTLIRPPVLLAVLLATWPTLVRADVALESYVERRSPDQERSALERLKVALQRHHVTTSPHDVLERIGTHLPRSGYPDRDITRTALIQRIERAVNRAAHEAYDESVAILESAFRDLDNNPALAASDPDSRSWVTKGRVALIFSYVRSKKIKLANDVIAEHIRSYPDLSLRGEQEEVEKLYDANMATLAKAPHGKLVFRVEHADGDVGIFVNAVARGKRKIELDLLPGEYRIVVRVGIVYRTYKMTVRANEVAERLVDWPADAAFTVASDWLGFVGSRESHHSVPAFVQQLAQRIPDDAVILIGIVARDGHRYVVANRYKAAPAPPRPERAVEADKADDAQIEALATYITAPDSEGAIPPSKGLVALPGETESQPSTAAPQAIASPRRWPVLVAVGAFSASVPAGAYLLKTRNDCYNSCSRLTVPTAVGLLGLGAAAFAFGTIWIIHADRAVTPSTPMLDIQPLPGGGVAHITGAF
jgi:hypothetical protein